jgi:AcrR family transcriptional regulator
MSAVAAPNRQRPVGNRRSAREVVLNAAFDLHADGAWERTAMRTLASAAGVSRQTLYNQFGDRDGVTQALLARETDRLLKGVDQRWRQARSSGAELGDCLAAAMSWTLAACRSHPLLHSVLTDRNHEPAGLGGSRGLAGVITELCHCLASTARTDGQPRRFDQFPAVEAVVRITLSYLLVPAECHQQARFQIAHAARALLGGSCPPNGTPMSGASGGEPMPGSHPSDVNEDHEREPCSDANSPFI